MGTHGGGGHQFDHILAGALRTFGRGIRWRQNQIFKTVATAFTLIFIDRHGFFLLQKNSFIDGFGRLVKTKTQPGQGEHVLPPFKQSVGFQEKHAAAGVLARFQSSK